jgi:hypothetical protein
MSETVFVSVHSSLKSHPPGLPYLRQPLFLHDIVCFASIFVVFFLLLLSLPDLPELWIRPLEVLPHQKIVGIETVGNIVDPCCLFLCPFLLTE